MTNTKEVQKSDPKEVVAGTLTRGEVATLKQTLTPQGISDAQFNLYIQTCAASGLNPFLGHIYAIPYNGKMDIQISVEGIHYRARKHPDYITASAEVIGENEVENFEAELVDGEFKIMKHKIALPIRGKAVAAYAITKRKGAPDQVIFMDRSEVEHLEKGRNPLWKSNFNDMFKKHVMKRALKAQFGVDIDDHTIQGTKDAVQEDNRQSQRREINIDENETVNEEELRASMLKEITQYANDKNITISEVVDLSQKHFKRAVEDITLQELTGLKRIIELQPAKKPVQKKDDAIEAEYTEVQEEAPVEPEKPSAADIDFSNIDFDEMQGEIPFE